MSHHTKLPPRRKVQTPSSVHALSLPRRLVRRTRYIAMPHIAVALCLAALPGCTAPVLLATAGVSAVEATAGAYVNGRFVVAERATLDAVHTATVDALRDLQFEITRQDMDDDEIEVVARTLDHSTVTVIIERKTQIVTKISVRVGALGDQSLSQLIMSNIQQRLKGARG
jgi:hypothetical protein